MAGPSGGTAGTGPSGIQRPATQIQQQIYEILRRQNHPQGWQTSVSIPERGGKVFQLVSSLRLIKPNMNPGEALSVAINFEHKAFQGAADKPSYETQCKEKLAQIRDTRARQTAKMQQSQNAQNVQMSAIQQASMQGMVPKQPQNQVQQGFPNPQLQHQMQASPLPPQLSQQQSLSMGMDLTNLQAPGQSTQQQPPHTQRHVPQQTNRDDVVPFTPQENQQINLLAQKMAQSTPRADLEKIRANLQNITPEQRQQLARQNIDPLDYFLRTQAARQFRANKVKMQVQITNAQQGAGVGGRMGGMPPGVGVMPQQTRPRSQNAVNGQGQQIGGVNPNQIFDPSFMGNIHQIIGQQAEALRSQDAGQLVVPASNNQGIAQQPVAGSLGINQPQASQNNGKPGATRPMAPNAMAQSQQQFMNAQQAQQEKMQQAAHMQAQSQAQARANVQAQAQHTALAMNTHIGQVPPPQSPAMPNINRPLGPAGQQSQSQGTPQQRSQQRIPQMSQQAARQAQLGAQQPRNAMTPQIQTNSQTQRPPIPPNVPPTLQQQMANLPDDQMRALLARWHNSPRNSQGQQSNGRSAMPQGPMVIQNQLPQVGQQLLVQGMQPGQAMNNQAMSIADPSGPQRPRSTQQHLTKGIMNQQELQQRSQQQQQQQREILRRQEIQRRHALQSLPPEKAQEMDDMDFPTGILNSQNNTISQVPNNVRTWGDLKAWVAQNPQIMPSGSLDKLKDLQYLHYSNLSNPNQRKAAQHAGYPMPIQMAPGSMPPNYGLGPAPAAPMIPQGSQNGQAPLQRSSSQLVQMPSGMPPLQQPTIQEVQTARMRLPDHLKDVTDEQVRNHILRTRYKQAMTQFPNAVQGQHPMPQQQAQYAIMQRAQQQHAQQQEAQQQVIQQLQGHNQLQKRQSNQASPNARPVQQQQRSRQPLNAPDNKTTDGQVGGKAGKPVAQARGGVIPPSQLPQDQKGVKRPSNDDVVEVPNPNLSQPQRVSQPRLEQSQPERRPPMPNSTAEQLALMPPQQRAQIEARWREQTAQKAKSANLQPINQLAQPLTKEDEVEADKQKQDRDRKDARLKQIVREVVQSNPKRQPIDMSPEVKSIMTQKLREAKDMVLRMEQSLPMFFRMFADEMTTRELISTRLSLVQQYDNTDYNPLDSFTISPEELDTSINKLRKYFNFVMQKMLQQKQNTVQSRASALHQQPPQPQPPQQPPQARMHPLNAANLQQQQHDLQMARRASLQKHHTTRDSRPPAAPTSAQPPFPIGAASPHGIPQAYGPNELTQEKLKFPPAKKRKGNQQGSAASTPAQGQGTPGSTSSPQLTKLASPEAQRLQAITAAVEAALTFKCPVESCEHNKEGFTSQVVLNHHMNEVHETKEPPIDDPLSWALESVAFGLGLETNGTRKPPIDDGTETKKAGGAQKMQATPSKQGQTPKPKQEAATPAAGTTTPMARPSTQTGPSPASSLLKTPQATTMKTVGSGTSGMKALISRSGKDTYAETPVQNIDTTMERSPTPPDLWADSSILPEDLMQCFDGLDTLQGIGSFSHMQASLTPASTQSSSSKDDKKASSRESDISENDQLQINIATEDNPIFNPFGLYDGLKADMEQMNFEEELMTMDWEKWLQKTNNRTTSKDKGTDEWAPSPAWDPSLFSMK
ncbi:MAG: hypothetical protein M1830_000670 [Pleopsidium flavum]|nr:MAG: hypothetical protein M1830_000670 [Pleopsidium flavum]